MPLQALALASIALTNRFAFAGTCSCEHCRLQALPFQALLLRALLALPLPFAGIAHASIALASIAFCMHCPLQALRLRALLVRALPFAGILDYKIDMMIRDMMIGYIFHTPLRVLIPRQVFVQFLPPLRYGSA